MEPVENVDTSLQNEEMKEVISEIQTLQSNLEKELNIYKNSQDDLRDGIVTLLSENKTLEKRLNSFYKEKLEIPNFRTTKNFFESEIILNLQKQLDLCVASKEKTNNLYEESLKVIENLEAELSMCQEGLRNKKRNQLKSKTDFSILESKCENIKLQLQNERAEKERLECQKIQFQAENERMKIILEAEKENVNDCHTKQQALVEQIKKLEQENMILSATLECMTSSRDELEKNLEDCHEELIHLTSSLNEAKEKVADALDVADRAINERDAYAGRESSMHEEIVKLQMSLQQLIDNSEKQLESELTQVRQKYNSNIEELLIELQSLKKQNQEQEQRIKNLTLECAKFEKLNSNKLSKEKISLIRGSETEILLLENQIDMVYKELSCVKNNLECKNQENEKLCAEIYDLKFRYDELLKKYNNDETNMVKKCNNYKLKIEELIKQHTESKRDPVITEEQLKEIEQNIDAQMKMNQKWKYEMKDVTLKFEERIKELKNEVKFWKNKYKKSKQSSVQNSTVEQ